MPLRLGTHDGPFHADDVLAAALVRVFWDPDAKVVRSRDREVLASCDVVFDVGHELDAARLRFDHHQREYEGSRSSAGLVLDHLEAEQHVRPVIAARLREELVDYVDAVDNGARMSDDGVPCFSTVIGVLNESANEAFDTQYERAMTFAERVVRGFVASVERAEAAERAVRDAMEAADKAESRVLRFDRYLKWKPAYFALGGENHPSHLVVFPTERDVRVLTIPVSEGSREDKVKLPESWGGLENDHLAAVAGTGARFCHKNRFIAAFDTVENALAALEREGLA
ncbi:MAG: MYG1 family protein [Myxococcota bacterium]